MKRRSWLKVAVGVVGGFLGVRSSEGSDNTGRFRGFLIPPYRDLNLKSYLMGVERGWLCGGRKFRSKSVIVDTPENDAPYIRTVVEEWSSTDLSHVAIHSPMFGHEANVSFASVLEQHNELMKAMMVERVTGGHVCSHGGSPPVVESPEVLEDFHFRDLKPSILTNADLEEYYQKLVEAKAESRPGEYGFVVSPGRLEELRRLLS